MKVKELIKKLSQLDQDKNIFVLYDMCSALEPEIEQAEEDSEITEIKKYDYYINAW